MATTAEQTRARARWRPRVQAVSGLIVLSFVLLHLINTFMLGWSFVAYDTLQRALRLLYQQPAYEAALVLALLVHMACGMASMWERRAARGRQALAALSTRLRWQRRAGWFLLLFVLGHFTAVRGASLIYGVYPQAVGLGFTMAFMPAYFYPYYFLLGLAGLYHGVTGLASALGRFGVRLVVTPWLPPLTAVGAALLALALLGAGGVLYATPDPYANDYARLVLRVLGYGAAP